MSTSPDGITWTGRTASSLIGWHGVAWSPSLALFAAVAADNTTTSSVMTSPDGITWTGRTASVARLWERVAWSPTLSLFTAVASDVGGIMTSPDGITWTTRTMPEANDWRDVTWSSELGVFIAVALTGTNRIMVSADGVNWSIRTAPSVGVWRGVTASTTGVVVAVGMASGTIKLMSNTPTPYAQLTGIPTSGAGSIASAIASGDEINILEQRDDAASQATYGIRQAYIQDRRLSKASAQARGDAELTLRKDPYIEGSYITTDTTVRSGRRVTISMASEWGISGTYTISRVRVFCDPAHKMPLREVTFSSNAGAADLYRLLRRLQEQQQQQNAV